MLLRNDILRYEGSEEISLRVLWLHPEQPVAVVIDVNASDAVPKFVRIDVLHDDLKGGRSVLLAQDPLICITTEDSITEARRERRNRAWSAIRDLVQDEPRIFDEKYRARKINDCVDKKVASRPTIWLYLRRYWQRGQTPNALLADFDKSGGKGKKRESLTGRKRGRPRSFGNESGINITKEIRRIFSVATTRYYATQRKFTIRGAYDQMIADFFCERIIDPSTGRVAHAPNELAEPGFPTYGQFYYWLEQDSDRLGIKRQRLRPRVYDKDHRGLLGTSNAEVWGPGARYQIDATIADVYLVSRIDRQKIIGRPVLYVVIDVFSRMIVGTYVGLEGPSWVGAMMALANTSADKVAFCQRYGREISEEDWPCHHLPAALLGDRGEIEGSLIETLINNFNVAVENAAAYRADWKGVVEQRFRLLPAKFKPYVPGYIEPDFRARGSKDYRLDAVLDIDQFTQIIIECVLYYNNQHEIGNYDRDRDMVPDEVRPIPIDLWEWGIVNRSGCLRGYPEEHVRFCLLPTADATVTLNGIRLKGLFYTCKKALEERWFDRARQNGTWKVKVSYDPRDMNEIYLHDDTTGRFQVCSMTERSRAYCEASLWEIEQLQQLDKHHAANHRPKQQRAAADLAANIGAIVSKAAEAKGHGVSPESMTARLKDIRQNRADEKQAKRVSETFRFGEGADVGSTRAQVVPLRSSTIDYSEPDITEILGTDDE